MPKDKVVYTAIFNNYDVLVDPKEPSEEIDYICFTDNKTEINSKVWEIIELEERDMPANEKNRLLKMKPHLYLEEYNHSIYVDGNIFIRGNISRLFEKYSKNDIVVPQHPVRDCIYQEAEKLKHTSKGDNDKIKKQIERYKKDNFPKNEGLAATRVILRKHNDQKIRNLMNNWWKEYQKGAKRDQLSFNYVVWKQGLSLDYMERNPSDGSFDMFEVMSHRRSGIMGEFDDYYIPIKAKRKDNKLYYTIFQSIFYCSRSMNILKQEGPVKFLKKFKNHFLSDSK